MARRQSIETLKQSPMVGSHFEAKKNQGYQLPLHLWQELHEEAGRRKRLGLRLGTQNAIACQALTEWLRANKGGE